MSSAHAKLEPSVGLILSGGGARAAYQVGVLQAIVGMLPDPAVNPFAIICGTSAGAINAASLASNADRFDVGVWGLSNVWGELHLGDVFRADLPGAARTLYRCCAALLAGGMHRPEPVSLLDCGPLKEMLGHKIDFARIQRTIRTGHLRAVCVTASSYGSGDSISFYQGDGLQRPWRRAHRVGRPAELALSHVLASCALPLAFPVVRIGSEHFGDGSMHQLAPISPALHLGARRVLAIGVGSTSPAERSAHDAAVWPSLAQIAGHMLDAIFIDTLDMDLERLLRVNQTLACIPDSARLQHGPALQRIEALVIRPSERIDSIAAAYAHELPLAMRFVMQRLGVLEPNGARVLSYLLFEQAYCRHLMRLGFSDGTAQRERILQFLGYGKPADAARARAGDGNQRKAS